MTHLPKALEEKRNALAKDSRCNPIFGYPKESHAIKRVSFKEGFNAGAEAMAQKLQADYAPLVAALEKICPNTCNLCHKSNMELLEHLTQKGLKDE